MRFTTPLFFLMTWMMPMADGLEIVKDKDSGFEIYVVKQGSTETRLAPAAGCNLYSIKYQGKELLKQPEKLSDLPGFVYGNPLLYPTPNRVSNATLKFRERTLKFKANEKTNFLHGLVHSSKWKVAKTETEGGKTAIVCELPFTEGTEEYKYFPFEHTLRVTYEIKDGSVKTIYTVDNHGKQEIPFGFALHPWFLYHNKREETFLTIPATHWMEAENLLPTGRLIELGETKYDARKLRSLAGFVIDDVYFGMKPDSPAMINFGGGFHMSLKATEDFTHLVVYTPEQPWFCVENQTCSTDAHNLHERGLVKEANLLIVSPGKKQTGSVEFEFGYVP